jgi:hypothetical protein
MVGCYWEGLGTGGRRLITRTEIGWQCFLDLHPSYVPQLRCWETGIELLAHRNAPADASYNPGSANAEFEILF